MSQSNKKPRIPVNIIAGPLGVGKTTAINHILENRPAGEQWAVLVNEYGLVGLDAALLERKDESNAPSVRIREVAGGCICCSAGIEFQMTLVLMLRKRPDRLLIEPTGLAAVSGILDTLDRKGIRESVDVRSVICLLDPARREECLDREIVRDQVDAADILLGARSDLASDEQKSAFENWAHGFFPKKCHVGLIAHGQVPSTLLDLVSHDAGTAPRRGHHHGTDHTHHHHANNARQEATGENKDIQLENQCDEDQPLVSLAHHSKVASTLGWICWRGWVFDMERITAWLGNLTALPGARRVKAVFRTRQGWMSFNAADGVENTCSSGYRRDSRFEVIIENEPLPPANVLEGALRECIAQPSK